MQAMPAAQHAPLFDICVNLMNGQFNADREAIIERAEAAGVMYQMITATCLESAREALAHTASPTRFCTAGIHPHDIGSATPDWRTTLAKLAEHEHVRAIGETGLDFNRNYSPRDTQIEGFAHQIELARTLNKPLFVHDRESGGEVLNTLTQAGNLPNVVIHCFTGTREELFNYLDADFYIGVTGWVCDERRGHALRELVPHIPLERLMIETDAPFLRPHNAPAGEGRTKRRNEPALLPYVLQQIASLYGLPEEEVANATTANARSFFGL